MNASNIDWSKFRNNIHYCITIFILFGGITSILFLNCRMLTIHAYFCILVIAHWLTNNNKCFISEYDENNKNNGYTLSLLKKIGINISPDNYIITNTISYSMVLIPLYISYISLVKHCNWKRIKVY